MRRSSENTERIASVLKMSLKIAESMAVAGMFLSPMKGPLQNGKGASGCDREPGWDGLGLGGEDARGAALELGRKDRAIAGLLPDRDHDAGNGVADQAGEGTGL